MRNLSWLALTMASSVAAQTRLPPQPPSKTVTAPAAKPAQPKLTIAPPSANVGPSKVAVPANSLAKSVPAADGESKITFDSVKFWQDSRWLAIGQWIGNDTIRWLGGGDTRYAFPKAECATEAGINVLVRPPEISKTTKPGEEASKAETRRVTREILQRRSWIAIEVGQELANEVFEIRSPRYKEMPECVARVNLDYGWKSNKPIAKPLLFLKPREYFLGHQIELYVPDKPERANIQLDLYAGFWMGSFPNATYSGDTSYQKPSTSIRFLPVAISRGEWLLPMYPSVGLMLALEQTLQSSGGAPLQNVLISDWFAGAFYQQILPILDGIQFRGFLKYNDHLSDQGTRYDTVAAVNRNAKNLIAGITANHYFAKRWMAGIDFEYGLPNHIAGRGVSQSYLAYAGRVGFRLTNFMLMVAEFGMRNYKASGYGTESLMMSNLGIRLEL